MNCPNCGNKKLKLVSAVYFGGKSGSCFMCSICDWNQYTDTLKKQKTLQDLRKRND